jgi:hypothetical protein
MDLFRLLDSILPAAGWGPVLFISSRPLACHVLEFEDVYQEEAKKRMADGGKKHGKVGINDTTLQEGGRLRKFMAQNVGTTGTGDKELK